MLIKQADDQSKRLALLESLQNVPTLDRRQRDWLSDQLWALRMGMSGERNAAHYIDHYFKESLNLAVLHDLRLELDDEVAQIDHLIISRGFLFYLLETKNFSGNLSINEHGEFTVHYGSGSKGIPSPLEQSKRHEKVLSKWLERLGITGRLGSKPQFFHAVLIDPKGTIRRPDPGKFDTSNVIKADQFEAWRTKHVDQGISIAQTLTAMVNLRGGDTVREWAEKLVRQHRPLPPQQWLPDFMHPGQKEGAAVPSQAVTAPVPQKPPQHLPASAATQPVVCARCSKPLSPAEQVFCISNEAIFGGCMFCLAHQKEYRRAKASEEKTASRTQPVEVNAAAPEQSDSRKRKLVCCTCDAKITFEEGKFCWNNERRFGGLQYCRMHQADYP